MAGACEQLTNEASLGAAPALRAVDCLSNEMASAAFGRMFGAGGALLPALTILLTLYIAFFAFSLLTGRSRLGISALTPRAMTLGLVLTFATSWVAWQGVVWNLAIGAPDQLAGLLTGIKGSATQIFTQRLDMVFAAISEAASNSASTATAAAAPAADGAPTVAASAQTAQAVQAGGAFSPTGLMWMGALLLLLGTVGVLVTARIALAVLLALGPVFVVMALFNGTRGLSVGWLRGLAMTALAPLFVVAGGSLMLELAVPVIAGLRGAEGIDARAAMALFLIAAVHAALMAMVMKVTGTMVSAWSVFGLAGASEGGRGGAAAGAGAAQPATAQAPLAAASPAPALGRTAAIAPVIAAAANAPASPGAATHSSTSRTTITQAAAGGFAQPSLPPLPRTRARGIGSRFAAKPGPSLKENTR